MTSSRVFHEGELAAQMRANETAIARMNGGIISDRITGGAIGFIAQQPMVAVGSVDREGLVWASVLFGMQGFLQAKDNRTLTLDHSQPRSATDDPLWNNIKANPQVGLLVIELESRRRLRVNGHVRNLADDSHLIDVDRAYPNCPKYIQRRQWKAPRATGRSGPTGASQRGERLSASQQTWIRGADTFFVASAHPEQGVDISHRGGRPGFVKVLSPHRLRIPDFAGNSMYNTLGNFVSNPKAGLAFVDFDSGRVLQLSGRPEILWELDDPGGETGGTRRYWEFEIDVWQESVLPFHLDWEFVDYSPFNPVVTGDEASTLQLQVEHVQHETQQIKRYRLSALNGRALPPFKPGAHLPIFVRLPDGKWAQRNYSILSDPADRMHYEIGVLAEPHGSGGSLYLHENVHAGNVLEAMAPKNEFSLAPNADHSILITGGIGITPILCMLRALKADGQSFELHYGVKRWSDLAFRKIIDGIAGKQSHFYASREQGGSRIDLKQLLATPIPGVHVYVCGPFGMITDVRELARANNWPSEQIHFESFGAAPLLEKRELKVTLANSGKSFTIPASDSILDALLDAGMAVPHGCKRGECSMCVTPVLDGEPDHRDLCLTSEERLNSMCICVSRAKSDSLTLAL